MDSTVPVDVEEEVRTTNIRLAAALLAAGKEVYLVRDQTDRDDPNHVEIVVRGKGLKQVQAEWDQSILMVNAKRLLSSLQDVRTEIRGGRG